ncbi:hypothetical protein HF690_02550 [Oleiagrimonas citrea]|uniref:Uncharacterized protein n=2 Tax=Oleiagrimonas citrea TaxID=1665687 RepID=A0A846ZJU7_9GAMM|nr:hypothetical protein [Oleiagrimonas citrea]
MSNVGCINSEAEMQKFVEITRKDSGFDKENSWYSVCEKERIPYITIKARSKLAIVQWDYMTYPPNIDKALFAMHKSIKVKVSAIYDRYASKESRLSVGPGVISFWNLELPDAREAASELYDLISEAASIAMASPQTES